MKLGSTMERANNRELNWLPVYVTGRKGFTRKLAEALQHSGLPHMPGYFFDSNATVDHTMFWVDESIPLETYKRAVGARTIFKNRIRFFLTLSEFSQFACRSLREEKAFENAA
jgi:hypothetical protein